MSGCRVTVTVLVLLAAAATGAGGVVVGTFDSRAVAAAYYRSAAFNERVDSRMAEYDAALLEGDSIRAEELSSLGESMQEQAHDQVFSTADVDEIIWTIYDRLPAVAEDAGVDVIISVWDVYYRAGQVEYVDVTDLLVAFFDPSEETLELVEQMRGIPAIPSPLMTGEH